MQRLDIYAGVPTPSIAKLMTVTSGTRISQRSPGRCFDYPRLQIFGGLVSGSTLTHLLNAASAGQLAPAERPSSLDPKVCCGVLCQ